MPGSVAAILKRRAFRGRRGTQLGDAEVEDLHAPVAREEDVLRLQIAMDDALLVRGGEALRDLQRDVDGLARRKRARVRAGRAASRPRAAR